MAEYKENLRRLALNDERFVDSVLGMGRDTVEVSQLDQKTHALVRLAASLAMDAAISSYQSTVELALAAGASFDEIVGTLIAVAPTVGLTRAVSAAPELALALGYDVDAAFETSSSGRRRDGARVRRISCRWGDVVRRPGRNDRPTESTYRDARAVRRRARKESTMRRRLAAMTALVAGAATIIASVAIAVSEFPRGLGLLGCVAVAAACAWYGVLRRGIARVVGFGVAGLALAGAVALLLVGGSPFADLLVLAGLLVTLAAARATLSAHVDLPSASAPRRPVLFFNPKSGGGKAERFSLASEARARGIEPIELGPPWDLEGLVRDAVADGADGLAMAGGDGSQAVVAAIAAELDLPYACVPAGTRNHFALDLGVDRDDVVGALDAFVDGGERTVDLAEVNGRVFVNNVSLGLYAEAVQRDGYRDAKLRTLLDTVPDVLGPDRGDLDLRWSGTGRARARFGCRGARLQQPLSARPSGRVGHPPADRRRPARHDRGRSILGSAGTAAGGCSARGASGPRRRSRWTRTGRSPPASTARRSCSTHR